MAFDQLCSAAAGAMFCLRILVTMTFTREPASSSSRWTVGVFRQRPKNGTPATARGFRMRIED